MAKGKPNMEQQCGGIATASWPVVVGWGDAVVGFRVWRRERVQEE